MNPLSKPTSKSNQNSRDGDPIAVHFNVVRPRDDHPLLADFIRFRGMAFARRGSQADYADKYVLTEIAKFGRLPRIYHGALLARGTEADQRIPLAKRWDDVRLMAMLLEVAPPHELSDLAEAIPQCKISDDSINYGRMPKHVQRCRRDAELLSSLYYDSGLKERIHNEGLDFIYRLERRVIDPTLEMIYAGVGVSKPRLEEIVDKVNPRVFALRHRLERIAGPRIKFDSTEQVAKFMHEKLELPAVQRTHGGNVILDGRTLRRLAEVDGSGFVALFQKYQRAILMQRSTLQLYRRVLRDATRVHPDLDPLATATGRFGCSDQALLALPKRLWNVIVAEEDHVLIEASLSQFDTRVLAHFSQDQALLRVFAEHKTMVDLHRRTAAIAIGIREDQVTNHQRYRIGRAINCGLASGQTEHGLAESLDIPSGKARRYIERFFQSYPRVREWMDATERQAESEGCVRTLYGRRRTLANVGSRDPDRSRSMHPAVNHVIEGTEADVFKLALRRAFRALPSSCLMLLPLHDSLLFEVPRSDVSRIVPLIKEVLEEPPTDFSVPLAVKIRSGKTWAECREAPCEDVNV